MKNQALWSYLGCARWSNRLLLGSLVGIAYLTLFPFRFDFAAHSSSWSPFLLGESLKSGQHSDFFLNILLFIPFGFGVSCWARKRGVSRAGALLWALAGGFLVSYVVELLQHYIPTRNSAWDDIPPNSMGAVAGFLIFEFCGGALLRMISKWEDIFERWLSPLRTAMVLLVYFGLWFGISIPLQQQTRLSNWDTQCGLFVGNDATGQNAWKGKVSRLQAWNRAIPEDQIRRMTTDGWAPGAESGLLASYDFTTPAPYLDQRKFLPPLTLTSPRPSAKSDAQGLEVDGASWLDTRNPVEELTRKIRETNQFTFRIICVPSGIHDTDGRIVSISRSEDNPNFHLRQEGTTLVFWLRNPLSETRSILAWYVPNFFEAGQARDIVVSYDGSDASIYLNGTKLWESYRLGPGVGLAHEFMSVQTANLGGYVVVYQTLVFLPAGLLIGIAARKWSKWNTSGRALLAAGLILPPIILELVLMWVSGREILAGNVIRSVLLTVAGILLINLDHHRSDQDADYPARKPLPS